MFKLLSPTGLFRSFQVRDFRLLWTSEIALRWAEQMEFVVLVWFVLEETDSALMVGLFGALRFFGNLFAPLWGSIADKSDRRKLLIVTRLSFFIMAGVILFLILSDSLLVWSVFVLVGASGASRAADQVMRQSLLADLMSGGRLMNAIALLRLAQDAAGMIGPVLGGVILSTLGMGPAYVPILVLLLVAVSAIRWISALETRAAPATTSVFRDLALVGGYLRGQPVVLTLLFWAFLVNFAAFPVTLGLLPVFARNELGTGPLGLSALIWALATGAFIGTIILGSAGAINRPGRFVILATLILFGLLLVFSRSQSLGVSLALLVLVGVATSFTMVVMDMMLLRLTSPEFRGRVVGVRATAVYGLPISLLASGALADVLGPSTVIVIIALIGVVSTLPLVFRVRGLWKLPRASGRPA